MTNFSFLENLNEFEQLKQYCDDAELFAVSRPDISAISARKALEFLVKTIYVCKGAEIPENSTLFEMVENFVFSGFVNDEQILASLHYIRKVGNKAAHGEEVKKKESKLCLENLHFFVGEMLIKLEAVKDYPAFDEELLEKTDAVPTKETTEVVLSEEYQQFVGNKIQKDESLNSKLPEFMSEAETRKIYIDEALREAGWQVLDKENVACPNCAGIEIEVTGMPNEHNVGYVDYVLFGRDNKPLAIVEAKKASVSPIKGEHQALLYAECLEKQYGYKPVIYYTNGYTINIIDGLGYPSRKVFGYHTIDELELLIQRKNRNDITDLTINDDITNRAYQKMAITKVCEHFNKKHRRALIVMATGTGKTRVAISLVDVLKRNNWAKNILFLADRTALVSQAKKNFVKLLPNETICELSDKSTKQDMNARIMFSTYQTMINYIDKDEKEFSIGRFDLIIIDEAHRSVFNKYGAIFEYFDCLLVGLTATPRSDIDKNTYDLFQMENGVPNFHYELDEAVKDGFLTNYVAFDRSSKALREGIKYSKLSEEDKRQIEMTYGLDENTPIDIAPNHIFRFIFNQDTVDKVLQDLMENGLKVNNGDKIGKTIIFAYNHSHAEFIVERFNVLYPELAGQDCNFCKLIDNYVTYSQDLIARFEERNKEPQIAVSVDMLDTGIDVPDILNLVFFKPVKSKIKFLQMIGRGTRLSQNIFGEGKDKEKFYIFDYCGNFEYFEQNKNAKELTNSKTLTQRLFDIKTDLVYELQAVEYQQNDFAKNMFEELKFQLRKDINSLNKSRILVKANLMYVDKFQCDETWNYLSKIEVQEIKNHISQLVIPTKEDDKAKIFDLKVLTIELSVLNEEVNAKKQINDVIQISNFLSRMTMIPQIKAHIDLIKEVSTQAFWENLNLDKLERVRTELRDLIKFLEDIKFPKSFIDTPDEITYGKTRDGVDIEAIKTYEEKVLDYLSKHMDSPVIKKIQNLEQIDNDDLKELERILWNELGTKQDYEKCSKQGNLAAFIRSLINLSQSAINEKFSEYLNDNVLNSRQQEFIKVIIDYVRQNGDITTDIVTNESPFTDMKLFETFGEKLYIVKAIVDQMHQVVVCA